MQYGVDIPWSNDIGQVATPWSPFIVTDVAAACSADANCKGFNNYGTLKSTVTNTIASGNTCLYTKSAHVDRNKCRRVRY